MIYKRSKTPTEDIPPTSEMADSLFMDDQQINQAALTTEDSMVLDLTGQLPDKVGPPSESQLAGANDKEPSKMQNSEAVDYSKPVSPAEESAAINTSPKTQKMVDHSAKNKTTSAVTNKPTPKETAAPKEAVVKTSVKVSTPSVTKASTKSEVKMKASKPGSTTSSGFYVVSGSFIVPSHAEEQVKKLKKLGYNGAMKKVFGSSEYYSAVVGNYSSRKEAEKVVSALTAKGEKAFLKAK